MRLGIIDPGFDSVAGHHYEWNRALAEECARRGVEVCIAAHRNVADQAATLPVERVFSHSIYDEVIDPALRPGIRRRSLEDFAALRDWLTADDILLVHSTARAHFCALSDWICSLPSLARPRCIILHTVGWFGGEWSVGKHEWSEDFRLAAERLSAAAHVTFGAINPLLCRDWEAHTGQPARLHPIPRPVLPLPSDREAGGPRFAFLGGGRHEKGFALLPDVLRLLFQSCPDAEAIVHATAVHASEAGTVECLRELEASVPRLHVHRGAATPDEYRRLLGQADVMLQPYDAFWYRARGSGIFAEAMAGGMPVVLPAGTWMAEEWARLDAGGALFHDWEARAVAEAAIEVARSFAEQRARSARAAERWNARHSTTAFVDFVLQP